MALTDPSQSWLPSDMKKGRAPAGAPGKNTLSNLLSNCSSATLAAPLGYIWSPVLSIML